MILLTGAAGFIGSCVLSQLNAAGREDIILVDEFPCGDKEANLKGKRFVQRWHREDLQDKLAQGEFEITRVMHLGARTDTAEKDKQLFNKLNLNCSKMLWQYAVRKQIPFIYASSAATYGNGSLSFADDHALLSDLKPLNPYAESKHEFDLWALAEVAQPPVWAGLKFFNVYGPNEYHKDRMSSVIQKAFHQIKQTGEVRLFRSHKPEHKDGEQYRDFVYVKDICKVCLFFLNAEANANGLFNVGSGQARSFLDLARATFDAMDKEPRIVFIDIPIDIRAHYQYHTEAPIAKLRKAGYEAEFHSLEEGVRDYVCNFLVNQYRI